jgi:hypothetical protein
MTAVHAGTALALSLWAGWRSPLVALAAALLAGLAGRGLRVRPLAEAAVGIGAAAGFVALAGLAWPPVGIAQRLAPIAAAATLAALLGRAWPRAGGGAAALLGGWFLAGAPLHLSARLSWIEAAGAAAVLALGLLRLGMGQVVLASVSLACALSVAHAGPVWVLAALVPGAALVGGLGARERLVRPAALAVAAVAAACVLSAGDLQRLSVRPIEAAAAAPVLALWLAARLAPRLRLVAGGVGLAAATLVVWMIAGGR